MAAPSSPRPSWPWSPPSVRRGSSLRAGAFVAGPFAVAAFVAVADFAAGALVAGPLPADGVAAAVTRVARRLVAAAGVPALRASSLLDAACLTASSLVSSVGGAALTMTLLPWLWSLREARRDCLRASSIEGASPSAIASVAVTELRPHLDQALGEGLGVDLVGVEPAQLVGQALRQLPTATA